LWGATNGCKARLAANGIGKGRNAADAVATLNPKGRKRFWRTAAQKDE